MLQYSKELSAGILKDFECGIPAMDVFIHESLDTLIQNDSRYSFSYNDKGFLDEVEMTV